MTKPKRKGWPKQAWAVCYRNTDDSPCWVPYSGEIFWYRDAAEKLASETPNSRIMSVWIHPTRYTRKPHDKQHREQRG